jgi:hypothetical protein
VTGLLLQQPDQQSLGSLGIAAGLDDLIENANVLVNGAPQPMFLTADGNHQASGAGEFHPTLSQNRT